MATGKPITISILADAKDATSNINKVADTAEQSESKFQHLGTVVAGVFGGELLQQGAEKAFDFLKEGVKEAAATQKEMAGLEQTMKNLGVPDDVIEKQDSWITALSDASGITKESLIPAYQKAVAATGSVAKGHQVLNEAMNLSTATGIKLTAAVKTVTNGYAGNVGALQKYGITATSTAGIQDQLNKKFGGDWKAAASTAAGEASRLGVTFDNFRESIGEKLLPVLTQLGNWFLGTALPAIKRFWTSAQPVFAAFVKALGTALQPVLKALANIFQTKVMPALKTFGNWLSSHRAQIQAVANVVGVVLADAFKVAARVITTEIAIAVKVIRGLINVIQSIVSATRATVNGVRNAVSGISNAFQNASKSIRNVMSDALGFVQGLGSKFYNTGKSLVTNLIHGLGGLGSNLAAMLKDAINSVLHLPIRIPVINTHIPGVGHVGGETLIPALASGGITTGPTVALIGDNPGGREAVIPLDKYALGGNTYSITVNAPVGSNPVEIGRTVQRYIDAYERAGGRKRAA